MKLCTSVLVNNNNQYPKQLNKGKVSLGIDCVTRISSI